MLSHIFTTLLGLASIRDCSNGKGRATLLGFDTYPLNPVAGDNVSLWVAYDLPAPEITGGEATYAVTLNYIPFPATVDNLCDDTACPKYTGFNNETTWSVFPSGLSGTIKSSVTWTDQNKDLVWCVETTWKV